jgi:hypothetical protein
MSSGATIKTSRALRSGHRLAATHTICCSKPINASCTLVKLKISPRKLAATRARLPREKSPKYLDVDNNIEESDAYDAPEEVDTNEQALDANVDAMDAAGEEEDSSAEDGDSAFDDVDADLNELVDLASSSSFRGGSSD